MTTLTTYEDYLATLPASEQKAIHEETELLIEAYENSQESLDIADCLTDEASINDYLNEVLKGGTAQEFESALQNIATAKGINDDGKSRFETLFDVLESLGLKMQLVSNDRTPATC